MRRAAAFALPALLLAGCAAASQAPAQTDALTIENRYPLEYAKQFTVDVCAGGYDLITIDAAAISSCRRGPLRPPIWTQTSPFCSSYPKYLPCVVVRDGSHHQHWRAGGCGAVRHAGRNWYLDAARTAMEHGEIATRASTARPITRRSCPPTAALPSRTQ